jgi:hypothetical protein
MHLSLETFCGGSFDNETRQYHILQGIKEAHAEFSHNMLYPTLRELLDLYRALEQIIQRKGDIESHLPATLQSIDLINQTLVYEPTDAAGLDFKHTALLITWALPLLRTAIEEGMAIFNFIDEHITIEQVGILPVYIEEGYWFVPDRRGSMMHVLRYEVSLFTSAQERFRALKTLHLESVPESSVHHSPESLKLGLIERFSDLPNPATFACETDMDFPFSETMMPIAKRKLMARVFS